MDVPRPLPSQDQVVSLHKGHPVATSVVTGMAMADLEEAEEDVVVEEGSPTHAVVLVAEDTMMGTAEEEEEEEVMAAIKLPFRCSSHPLVGRGYKAGHAPSNTGAGIWQVLPF